MVKTNNIEQLAEAIKKIIELKGINVFENPVVFCSMIDDLAPKLTKERKIFHRILDDKILLEIKKYILINQSSKIIHGRGWSRSC